MTTAATTRRQSAALAVALAALAAACARAEPSNRVRVSGHVEATDVQIAPEVGGRVLERTVDEGARVNVGDVIARLDTRDTELAIRRAEAERAQALAHLALLRAGPRPDEVRQAEAQVAVAEADLDGARAELTSAEADLQRFEALLRTSSGSQKQRDDANTRRELAREKVRGAEERIKGARAALANLRAGSRREEIEAAVARVGAVDAQIATLQKNLQDATLRSPAAGIVTQKLVEAGEIIAPRTPIVVVTDLDRAWAEVFLDEPVVPRIRLGQAATVFTDAGGPGIPGTVSFVSPKAEFTPRNVQTADERSKLVYRIKVAVDNRRGILKEGMPVEAELELQPLASSAGR